MKVNKRKAIQSTDILVKILSQNTDIFEACICVLFNKCIGASQSASILKQAGITPVLQKEFKDSK